MIHGFVYQGSGKIREINSISDAVKEMKKGRHTVWLALENPKHEELMALEKQAGFHPLTIEDIIHSNQRPKFEDFDSYAFITARGITSRHSTKSGQVSLYLGKNYVVTVNTE